MQRFEKWTETYKKLRSAGQKHSLGPKDLETYALAAYLTGSDSESFQILERAHQAYLDQEQTERAVRCAFWQGLMLMNSGKRARSSGWMARGKRLLADKQAPDCAEKGLFLIPAALENLSSGHPTEARKLFEKAVAIGERFDDHDLIALGRLGQGQAIIQQGDVAKGIRLLDETMITIQTEAVFPVVNGIVYCAVIEACRQVWDLRRAYEWTAALSMWCETQPDIVPFRGQCLVRRAEIIQYHGNWVKALKEAREACQLLTRPPGEPAAGEAYYRQAELLRLMGKFKEAEDSYLESAKWGRKPQPGLALLRLAQGQEKAAETAIRNTLMETKDTLKRAELLVGVVRIMVTAKQIEAAMDATKELGDIAKLVETPYLYASYSYCQGAVLLADGNSQLALEYLHKALKFWNTANLPYESAQTRELKGLAYLELNDKDNSNVELAAAQWVFKQLRAIPDLERINRLLNNKPIQEIHGLTLRELQVLRRVASGKTNKLVARELFISRRTVDRHVSNIFNKLGVSSRAEATAYALKNNILDS